MNNWHIVGKGAIGLLWAAHFHKANRHAHIILRDDLQERTKALQIDDVFEFSFIDIDKQPQRIAVTASSATLSNATQSSAIQKVIIPTKAYDALNAFKSIQSKLTDDAVIILCHNGLGTVELITPHLSANQHLIVSTTTHGSYKNGNEITHTGLGTTYLGTTNQTSEIKAKSIAAELNRVLAPVHYSPDLQIILWKKLAVNCVINPLTAIYQIKNGVLAEQKYASEISQILKEWHKVALCNDIPVSLTEMHDGVYDVIRNTAQNNSSMFSDIQAKRKTEIQYINGFLVKAAQNAKIDTPVNHALVNKVLEVERSAK